MSTPLHWATLVFYLLGTGIYLGFVISQRRGLHRAGRAILWCGLGLHTLALASAWWESGVFPAAGLRQSLDVFSWALMAAGLGLNLRLEVMVLGALIAPLSALLLMAAEVLPAPAGHPAPLLKSLWVTVHVIAMLLGYGLLAVTFLGGVLYLVQDRQLRIKNLGPVFKRLPSLSRLDQLCQGALLSGFTLMTVGLILGAVYAQLSRGAYWSWDPKEVWALITWLMYAALLHTRLVSGWRGRRGAWLATAAFACLLFTFLVVGIWWPSYHAFHEFTRLGGPTP